METLEGNGLIVFSVQSQQKSMHPNEKYEYATTLYSLYSSYHYITV